MNRRTQNRRREAPSNDEPSRWTTLMQDDISGIDGDIERLIGVYQTKYGFTHEGANAELVRRLSSSVGRAAAPLEDSCCS
jgi:hypothetical protein